MCVYVNLHPCMALLCVMTPSVLYVSHDWIFFVMMCFRRRQAVALRRSAVVTRRRLPPGKSCDVSALGRLLSFSSRHASPAATK